MSESADEENAVAEVLCQLLERRTPQQLSSALHVCEATISRWRSGQQNPTSEHVRAIHDLARRLEYEIVGSPLLALPEGRWRYICSRAEHYGGEHTDEARNALLLALRSLRLAPPSRRGQDAAIGNSPFDSITPFGFSIMASYVSLERTISAHVFRYGEEPLFYILVNERLDIFQRREAIATEFQHVLSHLFGTSTCGGGEVTNLMERIQGAGSITRTWSEEDDD